MKLTGHARERMVEMGVDIQEVMDTYRNPILKYPAKRHANDRHPNSEIREFYHGERICLVIEHQSRKDVGITVLWREHHNEYDRATYRPAI